MNPVSFECSRYVGSYKLLAFLLRSDRDSLIPETLLIRVTPVEAAFKSVTRRDGKLFKNDDSAR